MFKKRKIGTIVTTAILALASIAPFSANAAIEYNDPSNDSNITLADSVLIRQYLAGILTPTNLDRLDFDNNGVITEMDAIKIQLYLLHLIPSETNVGVYGKEAESVLPKDSERSYRVYNAATRSFIKSYTLSEVTAYLNGDSDVTGYPSNSDNLSTWNHNDDDRYVDWSKSGTVKLMSTNGYMGTGFVVAPHVIATCAHCVYGSSQLYDINGIKLFNTNGTVSMIATPKEISIPTVYYESSSYNASYDYALITVEEDLSEYMTYKLGVALDSSFTNHTNRENLPIYVTGFPSSSIAGDNNYSINNMITGVGKLLTKSEMGELVPYQLVYDTYMSSGNSGSPAYIKEEYNNAENHYSFNTVVAINSSGATRFSAATRITTELLLFYKNNPYINW